MIPYPAHTFLMLSHLTCLKALKHCALLEKQYTFIVWLNLKMLQALEYKAEIPKAVCITSKQSSYYIKYPEER